MARFEPKASEKISADPPVEILNQLFRDSLDEVWHNKKTNGE
jgi:hypothetical protein